MSIGTSKQYIDSEEKQKKSRVVNDWVLAKWVLGFLKDYKGLVILAILLIAATTALDLVSPLISGKLIGILDREILTLEDDYKEIIIFAFSLFGIAIASSIFNLLKFIVLYRIGFKSVKKIRDTTFSKLQSLSLKFFDTESSGNIISRVSNDCNKVNELMSGSIITSFTDFITVIGITVILLVLNWQLALICLGISLPLILIISYFFRVRARRAYRKTRETIATVTSNLAETIDGVKVSKSYSQEKQKMKEFRKASYEDQKANIRAEAIFAVIYPIFNFLASAMVGIVYLYTGWTLSQTGTILLPITIDDAYTFTLYIGKFFTPILSLTTFYNVFQSTMAATERIYELNHRKSDVIEKADAIPLDDIKGNVRFKNVRFSYVEGKPVLRKFSLDVKAGESIAIVGPTGAGKTTITNLLARFYEIQKGTIDIDGTNIQDVTLNSLHNQIGIVPQDSFLFTGTIRDNISYANPEATEEEIIDAAKLVNAHDFIKLAPQGYDTPVGEGGRRLSVGQKQLIAFARAIIDNPKILILDEATSSVDPYTEMLIKDAMSELLKNRTSFIIAHRLSTVKNVDRIIVIKKGKIVEEGSNDELLAKGGEYSRLYNLQFKSQE